MPRSTVSLTLTLPPVAHGAIAALAHLAGDNRAGGAVLALAFAEMERRQPGLWARIALQAFGARAEGETAEDIATRARQLFLEALASPRSRPVVSRSAADRQPMPPNLAEARAAYFAAGGVESDIGPRDDAEWYLRRTRKLLAMRGDR